MGYYSDIRVTLTKDNYITMLNKNERLNNICRFLPDINDSYVHQYKENGKDFVLIQLYDLKYYEEFEEVQQFEEFLEEVKSGYVFFRVGGRWDDMEYRNNAKYKELEKPFKFIELIENKAKEEYISKDKNLSKDYKIKKTQFLIVDKYEILNFYKSDKEMKKYIQEQYEKNNQLKLVINVNTSEKQSRCELYIREPKEEKYSETRREYYNTNELIKFFGYPNVEKFLLDINKDANIDNKKEIEEEEEFE